MGRFSGKIYQEAQRLITLVGDIIRLSQLDEEKSPAGKAAGGSAYDRIEMW